MQSFWACSSAKKGYSGVTTYCSTSWSPTACQLDSIFFLTDGEFSNEGRIVLTDLSSFVLINVYVPNAGRRPERSRLPQKLNFLKALLEKCRELEKKGREVILVGDFNVCADARDVYARLGLENAYSEEEINIFRSFLLDGDGEGGTFLIDGEDKGEGGREGGIFIDVWRYLHPDAPPTFTVWDEKTSARAFNEGQRIDFVLATKGLVEKITSCEILSSTDIPPKWSDHAAVMMEMDVEPPPQHPPCKEWTQLNKKFNDPTQRSILSMFGKRKAAAPASAVVAGGDTSGGSGCDKRKREKKDSLSV